MIDERCDVSNQANGPRNPVADCRQARCHLQVLIRRRVPLSTWRVDRSERPFWRLYWNVHPGAWIRRGRRRIPLCPDRWFLVAPGTCFSAGLDAPVEHGYTHFLLGQPFDRIGPLLIERDLDALTQPLLAAWFDPRSPDGAGPQQLPALMALVGMALADLSPRSWPRSGADAAVALVLDAMHDDPARSWRNADLARLAGLPLTTFNRRFRKQVGQSPMAHLMRLRMDQARILLEHDDQGIEVVATLCGFGNRSHFSLAFKQAVGMAPAAYRRHCRALTRAHWAPSGRSRYPQQEGDIPPAETVMS